MRSSPFLIVFIALLTTACTGAGGGRTFVWQDESVNLVWPSPPDKPRLSYLRFLSGPADFRDKASQAGFMSWLLGEPEDELPFLTPFAVAASRSMTVWVADNGARMLYRYDLGRKRIDYFQEFSGQQLITPSGVAVDDTRQRVYLSDAGYDFIFVLDINGKFIEKWRPDNGFKRPAGLALDASGQLLVADAMGGEVYLFSPDGQVARRIVSRVNSDGLFRRPLNVAFGPDGNILILDAMAFRVEVQTPAGELVGTIGRVGDAAGHLARPKGLAVDLHGNIFISDAAFDNIQVFDMAGQLLMYFGGAGGAPGQFNLPAGLFVDHEGRLFAADSYNHRVQVFSLMY